jgi:phosphohistidine swiveling domain-containing protein
VKTHESLGMLDNTGKKQLSKGQILLNLKDSLEEFFVPDLLVFSVTRYKRNGRQVLEEIRETFGSSLVAVRSSAASEDTQNFGLAGAHDSVLNIRADDLVGLKTSFDTVVKSYKRKSELDEVIVQVMVLDVSMSGVVFTHDLNTGAPYIVVNYDDITGSTQTVTSGYGVDSNRTIYIHRGSIDRIRSNRFRSLLVAIKELEIVLQSELLDIEFAVGQDLKPYLLQVRPITTSSSWRSGLKERVTETILEIEQHVGKYFKPRRGILGRQSVFGQMPDWNPAEMIGRAPRALARTLYEELITNSAWADARKFMGYVCPESHPLMIELAGQPYIDCRLSFNSYLPANLSRTIGEKLVNTWTSRLIEAPELHDKIEFEVAITTYSFDLDQKLALLVGEVLTAEETNTYKEALLQQITELIEPNHPGSVSTSLGKIRQLLQIQTDSGLQNNREFSKTINHELQQIVRLGTVPFAILARHGFIAKTLLNSLVNCGAISPNEAQKFESSIQTVASDLVVDLGAVSTGGLGQAEFMSRYGHLRPGTYDILSPRYDQMSQIFSVKPMPVKRGGNAQFTLSRDSAKSVEALLLQTRFPIQNAPDLFDYFRAAVSGREYAKFIFTRSLSDFLERIAHVGKRIGLSRHELSNVGINELRLLSNDTVSAAEIRQLKAAARIGSERHDLSVAIRLPQILFDKAGVHVIPFQVSKPNFITSKRVSAELIYLDDVDASAVLISGKIVLIESADPGFDWIFSQEISGLITKYGGVNSHMAIRCAEFRIPAAIGCGERQFEELKNSARVVLDCGSDTINIV